MKTLEVIRIMDGFEKRLAHLQKEYDDFKEIVDSEDKPKKVGVTKTKYKKEQD